MERIKNLSAGAKFVRADLHIHSFGTTGSFDVTDEMLTPENIVNTSISKNLSIISITDHNEIQNVEKAIEYASGKDILVIPGIEVSTTQGHLLVYFETFAELKKFYNKLTISEGRDRCNQGIVECLEIAQQLNGISILAHIELTSGFEKMIGRFGNQIEDILVHPSLYGFEITHKDSVSLYTEVDDNESRRNLIKLRIEKLNLNQDFEFPKVMSSDAHSLDKLGTNAEGNNRLTRIKVDSLNFQGLKIALLSHNSRIRLEDLIPEKIPHFVGISIDGALLDKQDTKFSKNLTCIIGGRGAGKSTLLETIRETSGNITDSKIVDSEVWPEKITLWYEDEVGQLIQISREKSSEVINDIDPANGLTKIPIESYGQGKTAETLQHYDKNPQVLIDFLDGFIDIKSLQNEEAEVRNSIIAMQAEINKVKVEISRIPEIEKQKKALEGKHAQMIKDKAGELVKYQTALIKEREIRKTIVNDLKELISRYRSILTDESVFKGFEVLSDEEIIVGKEYFKKVKDIVKEFSKVVASKSEELNKELNEKIKELNSEFKGWTEKEKLIQIEVDNKKADLEAKGIPFDLGRINQIALDLVFYQKQYQSLLKKKDDLKELLKNCLELTKKRLDIKDQIYFLRFEFARSVNENLHNSVDNLFVTIKYQKGTYSPFFVEAIKNIMQWRTSRVPKAEYIAKAISPIDFVNAIKKKDLSALKSIRTKENEVIFNESEIKSILEKFLDNNSYEELETVIYDDLPNIFVSKEVIQENGDKVFIKRELSQLSLGQQQSILLAILLQSKSKVPLLIDQPEDNLDSEFIFKTIVDNLRRIKESRQVIIVTHNPNIAVLGDAELIIPLKSTNNKTVIQNRGSIDRKETRLICCDILEGGQKAFIKRKEIYGI